MDLWICVHLDSIRSNQILDESNDFFECESIHGIAYYEVHTISEIQSFTSHNEGVLYIVKQTKARTLHPLKYTGMRSINSNSTQSIFRLVIYLIKEL